MENFEKINVALVANDRVLVHGNLEIDPTYDPDKPVLRRWVNTHSFPNESKVIFFRGNKLLQSVPVKREYFGEIAGWRGELNTADYCYYVNVMVGKRPGTIGVTIHIASARDKYIADVIPQAVLDELNAREQQPKLW